MRRLFQFIDVGLLSVPESFPGFEIVVTLHNFIFLLHSPLIQKLWFLCYHLLHTFFLWFFLLHGKVFTPRTKIQAVKIWYDLSAKLFDTPKQALCYSQAVPSQNPGMPSPLQSDVFCSSQVLSCLLYESLSQHSNPKLVPFSWILITLSPNSFQWYKTF